MEPTTFFQSTGQPTAVPATRLRQGLSRLSGEGQERFLGFVQALFIAERAATRPPWLPAGPPAGRNSGYTGRAP